MKHSSFFVYFVATITALGGLLFGYDTGVISGAILFIRKDFSLTSFETELVVSAILLGAIIGALVTGNLTDRFGRKRVIISAALLFIVGAFISAFAPNKEILISGRVLLGIAIGGASMTVPLYISEISPPKIRGFLVSLNQVMITAGILISYLVDLYFSKEGAWRFMLGYAALPALLLWLGMLLLPESPRWLLKRGYESQARSILSRLHTPEFAQKEFEEIKSTLSENSIGFRSLFQKAYLPAFIIGIGLAVFQQISGINTIIYYAPIIFEMTGLQSNVSAILATAGIGVVNFLMTLVAIQLIDRLGRRPLLLVGVGGMFFSLLLLGLAFKIAAPSPLLGWITALCLVIYIASFAISLGPIFWLLIAEIYPLTIRGRAMSVATFFNWGSNLIVGITFLTLIDLMGKSSTFWLYGFVSLICWFFIYFLVPETKEKTLEQIEQFWKRNH